MSKKTTKKTHKKTTIEIQPVRPTEVYGKVLRIDKEYQGDVAHFGICVYNNSS